VVVPCCYADHKVMCIHFGIGAVPVKQLLLLVVTRDIKPVKIESNVA